jgi:hypothetical protein
MPPIPHFHSKEQLVSALHAGLATLDAEYAATTEPTQLSVRVRLPDGSMAALATVSVQPLVKRKKQRVDGEEWGGYHAHLLFKRKETGAVARIKELLDEDSNRLAAVWAAYGKSRTGVAITHKTYLAESLADKAWATFNADDKSPWQLAAEAAKRHLNAVDWSDLDGALDQCKGFKRFLACLKAMGAPAAPPALKTDALATSILSDLED